MQFSRSIGGTLGVSVMGAVLSAQLASGLLAAGIDPASVSLNALLDPIAGASNAALDGTLRTVLAGAIQIGVLAGLWRGGAGAGRHRAGAGRPDRAAGSPPRAGRCRWRGSAGCGHRDVAYQ